VSLALVEGMVSTIIPVYNRPLQLQQAVDSVLAQDYRPIEILIVDDGSTDGRTAETIRELEQAHPALVRGLHQSNAGPGGARETGRRQACGEFIQYLDSDDILLPGKFSRQVAALRQHPDAQVAYGITFLRDRQGHLNLEPHKSTGKAVATMFPSFLLSRWWETATPLYRGSICEQAGPWSRLCLEEDWEYDCRIASLGGRLVWCPIPVSEHRQHKGERLSEGNVLDPSRLRQRAKAQDLIHSHAVRYGCQPSDSEMQIFARSLFLLARQCGAAGLCHESQQLAELALKIASEGGGRTIDIRLYTLAASLLGWQLVGRLGRLRHLLSAQAITA
jgi:GT2 family glycosyltransferase